MGVGSDMVENGRCLGALDSLVFRSEKDANDASGPLLVLDGACRRRKKALIRVGRATVSRGHGVHFVGRNLISKVKLKFKFCWCF
jgi:hypothetical protein